MGIVIFVNLVLLGQNLMDAWNVGSQKLKISQSYPKQIVSKFGGAQFLHLLMLGMLLNGCQHILASDSDLRVDVDGAWCP